MGKDAGDLHLDCDGGLHDDGIGLLGWNADRDEFPEKRPTPLSLPVIVLRGCRTNMRDGALQLAGDVVGRP